MISLSPHSAHRGREMEFLQRQDYILQPDLNSSDTEKGLSLSRPFLFSIVWLRPVFLFNSTRPGMEIMGRFALQRNL